MYSKTGKSLRQIVVYIFFRCIIFSLAFHHKIRQACFFFKYNIKKNSSSSTPFLRDNHCSCICVCVCPLDIFSENQIIILTEDWILRRNLSYMDAVGWVTRNFVMVSASSDYNYSTDICCEPKSEIQEQSTVKDCLTSVTDKSKRHKVILQVYQSSPLIFSRLCVHCIKYRQVAGCMSDTKTN